MADTTVQTAEPKRLTRAGLLGTNVRIQKTYGHSVLGISIALAYERALGCRDSILELSLARARFEGRTGFQNTQGERCVLNAKRVNRIRRKLYEIARRRERHALQVAA